MSSNYVPELGDMANVVSNLVYPKILENIASVKQQRRAGWRSAGLLTAIMLVY